MSEEDLYEAVRKLEERCKALESRVDVLENPTGDGAK